MGRKARILQSLGLNYSSREIAVFSVSARKIDGFLGRVSRAGARKLEMLNLEFPKNNWGELLFCIELFSNFAPVIRGKKSARSDHPCPLLLRRGTKAGIGHPM
jgi:hypothetical protein